MKFRLRPVRALVLMMAVCASATLRAQSGEQIAVVVNESSPDSIQIGEYYVRQRAVPPSNVIRIRTAPEDVVERTTFTNEIEAPISAALGDARLQDRILYIVLTKGIPLRVAGTGGREGTTASVDSELTLLYRKMVGEVVLTRGSIPNPYFLGTRAVGEARPFTHREQDIFLVSRLDGFTARDAMQLIDRCSASSPGGQIVLDQRGEVANRLGDAWLDAAASKLQEAGHSERVVIGPAPQLAPRAPVVGYYSWGSTDPQNRKRTVDMTFAPGAIAATFVSTDARTFREPPADWVPLEQTPRAPTFAGTRQSLIGDLIRQGVSGAAGHVAEPYLQSVVRPEALFPAYLSGFNLVESFYLAMPSLSWQTVVVGDPLCHTAPRPALAVAELDPGIDPETEQPRWFAERQKKRLGGDGLEARAVALWVRAENFIAQRNPTAARLALEEATRIDPTMIGAHMKVAEIYTNEENYEGAIERYRTVLKLKPEHLVALNNLAYAIAVHLKNPEEAMPLARRAVVLAKFDGSVLDTLAWIEHLSGDSATASKRVADAVRRKPDQPDIRLHAALIYAAVNAFSQAKIELAEALRLKPEFATRDEVRELQARLAAGVPKPSTPAQP
jgi:uncharacterized protein (TIGR03790 family)